MDENIGTETRGTDADARVGAYKCPNCGAVLLFEPSNSKFCCEFCSSEFTEADLGLTDAAQRAEQESRDSERFGESMNEYSCPNCGAEVIADANTAADFCCYCHSPIVLHGRVRGQMKPDKVVPFAINRDGAKQGFVRWAKKKWFVPSDFKSDEFIDKITGIYYPFWVTDADTEGSLEARATRVRTWSTGNTVWTETRHFKVLRSGDIHFEDISTAALSDADKRMLEGILPYPSDRLIPFEAAYLSGFLAKKRDIERRQVTDEVRGRMNKYAETLLRQTINGYNSVAVQKKDMRIYHSNWDYALMPIWMLIYNGKRRNYTFAMNGTTGKLYGELPISWGKLLGFAAAVLAAATSLFMLIGGAVL